jgi:nucleoid DNA-binding protein
MAKSDSKKPKTTKPLSKSAILQAVAELVGEELSRKQVKLVIESLVEVGHRELKKTGVFVLPGFAKFVVVKKPARPAREGINPFTKEKQKFAAKPASKGVRARPVKAVKDAVGRSEGCRPGQVLQGTRLGVRRAAGRGEGARSRRPQGNRLSYTRGRMLASKVARPMNPRRNACRASCSGRTCGWRTEGDRAQGNCRVSTSRSARRDPRRRMRLHDRGPDGCAGR